MSREEKEGDTTIGFDLPPPMRPFRRRRRLLADEEVVDEEEGFTMLHP